MNVEQMRARIIDVYGGPTWRLKVQEMSERQVIAIYKDMERKGRFDKIKKQKHAKTDALCEQLTIFDFMKEE